MEITTVYQKERNEFGRPVHAFQSTECSLLDEFAPDPEMKSAHIERNPSVLDIQAIPEMSETTVRPPAAPRPRLPLHASALPPSPRPA